MSDAMRVLLVGSTGQVGRACQLNVPANVELRACSHAELDITDAANVASVVSAFRPEVLINAAAYAAVDKAESDQAAARLCNADGARNLAVAIASLGDARMLQVSTDFVFDGKASSPYLPDAPTGPLSVYGATKLAGEQATIAALGDRAAILRTAWVYSAMGNNFMRTMLRLMAHGKVRVIADQVGTPTSAASLAEVIWRIAAAKTGGIFHWTDAGVTSRYDFAVAIAELALEAGLLTGPIDITPVATSDYPTPARRPSYSVLDTSGTIERFQLNPVHWKTQLRGVIEEMRGA